MAGTLYLATYPVSGFWFGLARVDSLFLLLLLAGLCLLRRNRTLAGALASALLLALAFFCKQTALVITLPVMAWLILFGEGPRRWILPAAWLILLGGGLWILQRASDGWLFYYLFYLPGQHPPVWWRVHHFWIDYFFKPLPVATLTAGFSLFLGRIRTRGPRLFWLAAAAGLFGGPWLASVPSGAFHNVAMPAHAALAMLFALAIQRWSARTLRPLLPWAAALLQLLLLAFNPFHHLPAPADRGAGEALVRRVAAVEGEVWLPSHGYLARMAGKNSFAHRCALDDVLRGKDEPGRRRLVEEIGAALKERKFEVVIANDDWLNREIKGEYGDSETIFHQPRLFWPLTGWQTRPEVWYQRRGKDSGGE